MTRAVILAGGYGSRLAEETDARPKPMVEIGGQPILWHIMKIYAAHGITDFVICLGYKGYVIKEYFWNYNLHMADVTINLATRDLLIHRGRAEPWKVTLVDTGQETMTGGRLRRIRDYVDDTFFMTYGDGLANIDIGKLLEFHRSHGGDATVTATRPPTRFGALDLTGDRVRSFTEKPIGDGGWINGGFFVLSPKVFDLIAGDDTIWEKVPMETLARTGRLRAYYHEGFWRPMDTLRDKRQLETLWASGNPPWKVW